MTQELENLYRSAEKADAEFQAAVIRQFGKRNAGDMRYRGSRHNAETKAAAERYWVAINAFLDASEAARKHAA